MAEETAFSLVLYIVPAAYKYNPHTDCVCVFVCMCVYAVFPKYTWGNLCMV